MTKTRCMLYLLYLVRLGLQLPPFADCSNYGLGPFWIPETPQLHGKFGSHGTYIIWISGCQFTRKVDAEITIKLIPHPVPHIPTYCKLFCTCKKALLFHLTFHWFGMFFLWLGLCPHWLGLGEREARTFADCSKINTPAPGRTVLHLPAIAAASAHATAL